MTDAIRPIASAIACVWACAGAFHASAEPSQRVSAQILADLSLEELSEIRITSVSRRDRALPDAAASISVIDARPDAISAHGFNGNIADKLLAMVDGSIGEGLDAVVSVRHVGELPSPVIPSYTATDLTLDWHVARDVQPSLGIAEYQGFSTVSEIPRSAFLSISFNPR
jgi:hypothetical protein